MGFPSPLTHYFWRQFPFNVIWTWLFHCTANRCFLCLELLLSVALSWGAEKWDDDTLSILHDHPICIFSVFCIISKVSNTLPCSGEDVEVVNPLCPLSPRVSDHPAVSVGIWELTVVLCWGSAENCSGWHRPWTFHGRRTELHSVCLESSCSHCLCRGELWLQWRL